MRVNRCPGLPLVHYLPVNGAWIKTRGAPEDQRTYVWAGNTSQRVHQQHSYSHVPFNFLGSTFSMIVREDQYV